MALCLIAAAAISAQPASADHPDYTQASNNIQFTLEGCDSSAAVFGINGPFICPDPDITATNDDDYTTGNLGKSWNELDLVPHRLTTTNFGDTAETYNIVIAADYLNAGTIGYDVISNPEVDTATPGVGTDTSDASCQVSTVHGPFNDGPSGGGADATIYRILEITQGPDSFCVFDYWIRLSLEASDFSGSSLQSYKFELVDPPTGDPTDFSVGKATISIPTNDVESVGIVKDTTATQGADNVWNLTKGATPTEYDFGCTCEDGNDIALTEVSVTIDWSVIEVQGDVKVVTNVYADNTASRTLRFTNIDDELFEGPQVMIGGSGTPNDPFVFDVSGNPLGASNEGPIGPVDVPGLTNQLLGTFTFDVDVADDLVGTTWSNKVTATVIDPFIGDNLGEVTAVSGAMITQGTVTNATAVITDVASISDAEGVLSYSVDSVTGATGAFEDGYVLGNPTQEDVTWVSDPQSANGSVTFTKTVGVMGPAAVTDGKLSDIASLEGSDGFTTENATAMTTLTSDANVDLTISKTITPGVLGNGQSETFTFDVFDGATLVEEDVEITIIGPATSGSVTLGGLDAGVEYTVSEDSKAYWEEEADQTITINLPDCEGSVNFDNKFAPDLIVTKTVTASATGDHDWNVAKSVNPEMQMGFPGDELPLTWTVDVIDMVTYQDVLIEGTITVENPMPYMVTAIVSDDLGDETPVFVDCNPDLIGDQISLTLPPGFTGSCSYSATPGDVSATLNTATATIFDVEFSASENIVFETTGENDSATVSDTQVGLVNVPVVGGDQLTAADSVTCATDRGTYTDLGDGFMYTDTDSNTATLTDAEGTQYSSTAETAWQCKAGFVNVLKTTNGNVDPAQDIAFNLYRDTTLLDTVNTLGDQDGILDFNVALVPGGSYTICESPVPAGFTFEIKFNGANVLTHAGPPGVVNPIGGIQCFDFIAESETTLTFNVNNSSPGGAPRGQGYWKNWNTCTGGNQATKAGKLGGVAAGVYLLDNLLPQTVGNLLVDTCEDGVSILDSRDISSGENQSSDGAYSLARQYLAAVLNQDAGACVPDGLTFDVPGVVGDNLTFQQVMNAAQNLLQNFTGTGNYLTETGNLSDRQLALALAGVIDDYNNSELCAGD